MQVRSGASCLPHLLLLSAVISTVLLTSLFVVTAAGRTVSVSRNQLVPGRGRSGERIVDEGLSRPDVPW